MFVYVTDAEGPVVINDNAAELFGRFVGPGYPVISKWVVYRFEIEKDTQYKPGDTLRMIVPFLKAYDVTGEAIENFSEKTLRFVPGAEETLKHIESKGTPTSIISTSYKPYVTVLCRKSNFKGDVFCTELNIDEIEITDSEKKKIKEYGKQLALMEVPVWPEEAKSLDDMEEKHILTLQQLNRMFDDILNMKIGRYVLDINPVGGMEKLYALKLFLEKTRAKLSNVVYFGDSITDVSVFEELGNNGGLAVSFNGNKPAVERAEIAVVSLHTLPCSITTEAFEKNGKKGAMQMASEWHDVVDRKALEDFGIPRSLAEQLYSLYDPEKNLPLITVPDSNADELVSKSEKYRKELRGWAGSLI
ncbi:MAG: hypothetical protein DRP13_01085 [Candidatus Aenigmatarchaeota archaeon]|nr:MAG: hypothetical protein DRP13_01085 [Candidatus Aenigmarchaeota archaeon]